MIQIYNGVLLNHKKEQNDAICSNMDGPRDCHAEWSKSEREREILCDIAYLQNLKRNDINELIYKTETDSQISKTNVWLPNRKHGGGRDKSGAWD